MVKRLVIIGLLIFTSSCSYYNHFVAQKQQAKACHLQCIENKAYCDKACRNNCQTCQAQSAIQRGLRFKKYKQQQINQGKIVFLELQSFQDPLQCRKVTCSCKEDYQICRQACTGVIHKTLKRKAPCREKVNGI